MNIEPHLTPLPYARDPSGYFAPWAQTPWAMLLDSGHPYCDYGRFDIAVAEPRATILSWGEISAIDTGGQRQWRQGDPLALVREWLGPPRASHGELPFCGGALGYWGYELGHPLTKHRAREQDQGCLPDMAIGLYDWAIVTDHLQRACYLVDQGLSQAERSRLLERLAHSEPSARTGRDPLRPRGEFQQSLNREQYHHAFKRIRHYLREGDCYQVNLAIEFAAAAQGDGWQAYQALRQRNAAPFGAYLRLPQGEILSCSPERFLRLQSDGSVETRPIKGTRPRVPAHPERDAAQARELGHSAKDRAENLMIVDLLRNDLGKCCQPGSIEVPELFAIESFATVHHLVSTVRGSLRPRQDAIDLLRAAFPGGSITGAPKRRAMEIIHELEPVPRSVYCGSIGYIGYDGAMDSNIAIRTATYRDQTLRLWAGGGVVIDSQAEAEYAEAFAKAQAFIDYWRDPS